MKDVENIEMKINVPSNMTPETAQQCFILGLRTLTYMYNQGVVVSYLDEFKNERNIKSLALRNEDAASVIKFVDFLQFVIYNKYVCILLLFDFNTNFEKIQNFPKI